MSKFNPQRLLDLRNDSGLSQTQLSQKTNVSVRAICQMETGHTTKPNAITLQRLAAYFGVKVEHFFLPTEVVQKQTQADILEEITEAARNLPMGKFITGFTLELELKDGSKVTYNSKGSMANGKVQMPQHDVN